MSFLAGSTARGGLCSCLAGGNWVILKAFSVQRTTYSVWRSADSVRRGADTEEQIWSGFEKDYE